MARKDRVPDPPKRRVQAPQRRSTPTTAADAERKKRLLYILGASAVAVLVVVLGFVFLGGGGGENEAAVLEEAGCTLKSYPAVPNRGDHSDVATAETMPKAWNSFPPSSGPHFGQTAVFGFYDDEVPLAMSTHNLEHGAVVIHYGKDVPDAEIEALRAFYDDDPNGLIVASLPRLNEKITLTAWTAPEPTPGGDVDRGRGFLAECTKFDEEAFSTFIDEHRGKGPERFPVDDLQPGSG